MYKRQVKEWSVEKVEVIPRDRYTRAQKPTVQYISSDALSETLPLEQSLVKKVAASAPLPPLDTSYSSSSADERIDEDIKTSPKPPQNWGGRKPLPGLPPYDVRGIPVTPTSTKFTSPFANYLLQQKQADGGTIINVNPTNTPVVSDAGGTGTGQVINAVDGVSESEEELEENSVEEGNVAGDSETDEMAEGSWSPHHKRYKSQK